MSESINPNQDPLRAAIAERVAEQLGWLNDAAEIIGGQGAEVTGVFTQAPEVRKDAPEPNWTEDQTAQVREIAHRFGYGAEQNVLSGVRGGIRVAEGGLAWKIAAELAVIDQEEGLESIVFAGSPYRKAKPEELAFIKDKYEVELQDGTTEYDIAHFFAQTKSSRLADKPVVMPFGYEVSEGNPTLAMGTGQLVHVGETDSGQAIQLLRVDREIYQEDDNQKYRYQPDSAALMGFVADVMEATGQEGGVALVTSNTYASRQHDAVRAGLKRGREFGVAMYGRKTLAEVKGVEMQPDSPLNQLPGDLRSTYEKLQLLQAELSD
jgi:hypothetical protein